MIETELKIALDADGLARLRRQPGARRICGGAAPRTETLVSVYYDTAGPRARRGRRLAAAAPGRAALGADDQAPDRRRGGERPLLAPRDASARRPAGGWCSSGPDPDGALAAVREAAGDAPLAPVFETRVRRIGRAAGARPAAARSSWRSTRARSSPARRARRSARPSSSSSRARSARSTRWRGGSSRPARCASPRRTRPRAATGWRATGAADAPRAPRSAGALELRAARRRWRRWRATSCATASAQIAANMAVVADSAAIEGPHQLRVGLRRLRTAFAVFGPSLGEGGDGAARRGRAAARAGGRAAARRRRADRARWWPARRGAASTPRRAARSTRRWRRAATQVRAEVRAALAGAGGDGLPLRSRRLHRGARLAGRRRTTPRPRGSRRRSARWRRRSSPSRHRQGDEARAQDPRARRRRACTSCARS